MFNIIPKPIKANQLTNKVLINSKTTISADTIFEQAANFLVEYIEKAISSRPEIVTKGGYIQLQKDSSLVREGYIIDCREDNIVIKASCYEGMFYAIQTLRIHFHLDFAKASELCGGGIYIEDAPRYDWRGFMLDVSRHYMAIDELKRLIDLMALSKLNVLHWHLTDDQGWRIEIKKYPLLCEIGSKRKDTQSNGWRKIDMKGQSHEGFYSQDDVREIVAYCKDRAIMVVPEIDMPAHFAAAMASYNHLACREIPCEVFTYFSGIVPERQGVKDWNRSACAGKESTYQFITDVIDEMVELFPAPYFHIGGDEAPKSEWKKCPHCQEMIRKNNLRNEEELQGYFNNRIYQHLKSKNKKMIGWNEVLKASNLDKEVIAQYWTLQRDKRTEQFVRDGGKVILSKHQSFYFDMCYAQRTLSATYNFNPSKIGIPTQFESQIIGVEGALWTEWVNTREKLDCTLFPRLQALSEVGWSQQCHKDMDDFMVRLETFKQILKANDVWYAEDEVADPKGLIKRLHDQATWYNSDQHIDVKYNESAKAKRRK